jgi:hypothetical protein
MGHAQSLRSANIAIRKWKRKRPIGGTEMSETEARRKLIEESMADIEENKGDDSE